VSCGKATCQPLKAKHQEFLPVYSLSWNYTMSCPSVPNTVCT
jgi:hypothetical protein